MQVSHIRAKMAFWEWSEKFIHTGFKYDISRSTFGAKRKTDTTQRVLEIDTSNLRD